MPVDQQLKSIAEAFRPRLREARLNDTSVSWYPYDTLGGLESLDALLGDDALDQLRKLIGPQDRVLDFGCGDGDLSFLLEHLGFHVDAIDNPVTNQSGMAGVRRMKDVLQSRISIHAVDADQQFQLPPARYGLAFCLGVLYHIKNPYYLLESLARQCSHLILSTRITATLPGLKGNASAQPVAYLLGEDELNADDSNFWILTEQCLRRLLERTRWRVLKYKSFKLSKTSDPNTLQNDERAFVLLQSVHGMSDLELLHGWHDAEPAGWRWTERTFGLRLSSAQSRRHKLLIKIFVPPEVLDAHGGSLRLSVSANGTDLGSETYEQSGRQTYARLLPPSTNGWTIDCTLDKSLGPTETDDRELGIIVASCEAEAL